MVLQRRVYFGALILWVLSVAMFPTWIGRMYSRYGTERWHESGVFGLDGSGGWYRIGPLWKPPRATVEALGVEVPVGAQEVLVLAPSITVRWPFQRLEDGTGDEPVWVIEWSWAANAARLSLGILVLGVLLRVWQWWTGPKEVDPVVATAWSVSLGLAIAWIGLIAVVIGTMGALLLDPVVVGILAAGVVGGLGYRIWSSRARPAIPSSPAATNTP